MLVNTNSLAVHGILMINLRHHKSLIIVVNIHWYEDEFGRAFQLVILQLAMEVSLVYEFLYIIASGRNDGVYKLGISVDPEYRLDQIKREYNVPNAFIVETMDVPTRESFAVEMHCMLALIERELEAIKAENGSS